MRRALAAFGVVAMFVTASWLMPSHARATPGVLELKAQAEWQTGTQTWVDDIAIGNVDSDPATEIVTVGGKDGTGQMRILGYDGTTFYGDGAGPANGGPSLKGVAIGNLDADAPGTPEIVTVGVQGNDGEVAVWHIIAGYPTKIDSYPLTDHDLWDLALWNLDPDSYLEIVTVGVSHTTFLAQMDVLSWTGSGWLHKATTSWDAGYSTSVNAVAIGELDGPSPAEIVTVGGRTVGGLVQGQVAVWHFTGTSLVKVTEQFISGGVTEGIILWDVTIGDPDNDLALEVVVVGGEDYKFSHIRTYGFISGTLSQKAADRRPNEFWLSVAVGDIDVDGQQEVVLAGCLNIYGVDFRATMAIARATPLGIQYELDASTWTQRTWPWATVIGDPNNDGIPDVFTAGQVFRPDEAQIRAWVWNAPIRLDDSWPQLHRDAAHSGWSGTIGPTTNRVAWSKEYNTGPPNNLYLHDRISSVVYDRAVFAYNRGSSNGQLYAFNFDGTDHWFLNPRDVVIDDACISLAAGGGRIYVAGTVNFVEGRVYAWDARTGVYLLEITGGLLQNQQIIAAPTIVGDLVIVGTVGNPSPGKVYAFDTSGKLRWTFSPGSDVYASIAVSGSHAYVRTKSTLSSIPLEDPDDDGIIASGEVDWSLSLGGVPSPFIWYYAAGSPTTAGSFVYVGGADPSLALLFKVPLIDPTPGDGTMSPTDISTGGGWTAFKPPLSEPVGWIASTPTILQGSIFVGGDLGLPGDGGFLYRLNDLDGSVVWRKDYANGVLTSAPAVDANEDVYIWAREGNQANVHAYDLNGNPLWSLTVHDNSFFGRDIGYGNSVALANGYLFVSNGVLDSDPSYTPATRPFLFAIHD